MKAAAWSFLLLCACTQTVSVAGIQGSTVAPTDTTASTSSAPVTPTDDQSTGLVVRKNAEAYNTLGLFYYSSSMDYLFQQVAIIYDGL